MRCPFCRQNIRIQGRFCPQCGEQIFGLPVQRPGQSGDTSSSPPPGPPRPVTPPASAGPARPPDDFDMDFGGQQRPVSTGGRPQTADRQFVGKTCPYCRFPIKPGDQIVVCPACQVPHHADCWEENQGCTTYGCTGRAAGTAASQWTVSDAPGPRAPGPSSPQMSPDVRRRVDLTFTQIQAQELAAQATNALVLSLLGLLCFLPAMIGFFMGLSVLGKISKQPTLTNHPARARATWAVAIGTGFLIIWGLILFSAGGI